MHKRITIILLFTGLIFYGLSAQERAFDYKKNLSIYDGLSHNGVTSIIEDSRGFLWIGTYDGLNRYNGYEVKVYKNTIDKNIFSSNRIRSIVEDSRNNLWIGTDNGVTVYNYLTEKFKILSTNNIEKEGIVRKIVISQDKQLVLCITDKNGVNLFDKDQIFLGNFEYSKATNDRQILFVDGVELSKNQYLIATNEGLLLLNLKTKEFKKIFENEITYTSSLLKLKNNTILATIQSGITILKFEPTAEPCSFLQINRDLEEYQFNSSLLDKYGNLWLGTLKSGLIKINSFDLLKRKEPYSKLVFKPETGLLRSSCIIASSNNTCWYGSFNKGLFRFDMDENPFKNYNIEMNYNIEIKYNNITHISPLDKDRVYLGMNQLISQSPKRIAIPNNGGITLFNVKSEKLEPLPFVISHADILNVSSVYVDSKKSTWITILGKGLYRAKANSKNLELVKTNNGIDLNNIHPRTYTEDNQGNIWIGCMQDIFRISVNKNNEVNKIESLNSNPYFKNNQLSLVRIIYKDPLYNYIWFGSDSDGLHRIHLINNKALDELPIKQYVNDRNNKKSISSNFVTSILRLPNKEFWVGTEGGGICNVLNSNTKPEFKPFTEKDGLSNNSVKSILYDQENNLWISTNVGLNKFDTKELRFRKFGRDDGLPFEDFWFVSSQLENGYFLFSGVEGLCYFNPKNLPNTEELPKFEFGDLKIFNKTLLPGDTIADRVLYKKPLIDKDILQLKYNENVFAIQLTSLHFLNPDNHFLKYRLLPINQEWIEVPSSQQFVNYSGLQSGEYTLEVMVSNSLYNWSDPKQLKIIILPPFWRTSIAYLIYVLIILIVFYFGIKILLRIQNLNHKLDFEQLEVESVKKVNVAIKEANEAKLRFFSNISHEIKTPLSLLKSPVRILKEQYKENLDTKGKLEVIQRQSKKILQLVDQVHDFQKAEAQVLKLNYSRFSFNSLINELFIDFSFMAENDEKKFEVLPFDTNIIVSADRDKLEKVFNNLLNNAFKYTKKNDLIKIEFNSQDKDLIVSISDSGRGIDSEDLTHVFERFYQSHNYTNVHSGGSGIGLAFAKLLVEMHYGYIDVESELNVGTTFKVRLPIVKKHEAIDEKETKKAILSAETGFSFKSQLKVNHNPENIIVDESLSNSLIFYVEDNLDMRMYVSNTLSKYFRMKVFRDGQECIEAMVDEWPDIVISDVQMPVLNGLDLCKSIKSDIKTSHIPIILLTALVNIEDKIQGIRDGADAYIRKPFNLQHLVTRTESLLINRIQLRERYQIGIPLTKENNLNNRNDNAFLEKLYNLMEANLDNQDLDINKFTKELYLNRTHFYQKVSALTNCTPFELLKKYRLKKAAEYIVHQNISIKDVYVMTGFKSRSHFSRSFKDEYGVSPGKYVYKEVDDQI